MLKMADTIKVGGMQPLTMIDFPGKIASVFFLQGCNLKCRFCYNHSLIGQKTNEEISWTEIQSFLCDRQGFIEGVVFSGGEPCIQPGLLNAMQEVKELGFQVALHTNGFFPEVVEEAINKKIVDFIAIDIKALYRDYGQLTGTEINIEKFEKTVKLTVNSGLDYELRTTVHPNYLPDTKIMELAEIVKALGVENYILQKFQHGQALDENLAPVNGLWIQPSTAYKLKALFKNFEVRGDQNLEKKLSQLQNAA
jgi:anaerobic ribonucleoside-triphosphate reductase activating protein